MPAMVDRNSFRKQVLEFERGLIQSALRECGANITATAKRLGISRSNLRRHLEVRQIPLVPEDGAAPSADSALARDDRPFRERVHEYETELLQRTIKECRGNNPAAAAKLGMDRKQFYKLLRSHQISLWPTPPERKISSAIPSREFKPAPGWVVILGPAASEFLVDDDPSPEPSS